MSISEKRVPNEYNSKDILIIGEAPGRDEESEGKPFVGQAGEMLFSVLESLGYSRNKVSLANLCQYRPKDNKFEYLEDSTCLKDGVKEIKDWIQKYNPKVIIPLGEQPLRYITGKYGISNWRGSVISSNIVATYHPAYILRDRSSYPIFTFDLGKAISICKQGYVAPFNNFIIDPRGLALEEAIELLMAQPVIAVDIESVRDSTHILCCGFAYSPNDSICIVNHSYDGNETSFYSALKRILEAENVKVFHNGLFDVSMLKLNDIEVKNFSYDTMIGQHVLEPELPKALDFLTSIYTDRPYYKDMGKSAIPNNEKAWGNKIDKEKLYIYNCLDCVATYEIYTKQFKEIVDEGLKDLFDYEMDMCEVALHISHSGMLIDEERVELIRKVITNRTLKDQETLNNINRVQLNVNSNKQLKEVLYERLGLPIRKNYSGGITTDENAIVSLMAYCQDKVSSSIKDTTKFEWMMKLATLKLILKIREQRGLISKYLNAARSPDGRIRSSYKVAATETGRWAANLFVDGTGLNAQTMPRAVIEAEESEVC